MKRTKNDAAAPWKLLRLFRRDAQVVRPQKCREVGDVLVHEVLAVIALRMKKNEKRHSGPLETSKTFSA